MGYATVMVQLELGRSNTAPLGVARDLARRLDASVSGVAAAQPIQAAVMADGFYGSDIVREDNQCLEEEAAATEAEFRQEMGGHPEGLDWHMSITMQPLSERISAAAGPADILVAGIDQQGIVGANPSRHVDIGDLIMQVGRPVLAVPLGIERFDFRCALVAWKDTRESRRALADSLPLLRLMDKVVIAQVGDAAEQEAVQTGLGRMAGWLGRHGVSAISRFVLSGGDDAERLLAVAKGEGADLIVAGAYGHSRLRQWVLGGVTRTLLTKGGRCLLLSH